MARGIPQRCTNTPEPSEASIYNQAECVERFKQYLNQLDFDVAKRIEKAVIDIETPLSPDSLLLLDRLVVQYSRLFLLNSVPSCLLRVTGEIICCNSSFRRLIVDSLPASFALYQIFDSLSFLNFWLNLEELRNDSGKKSILSKCMLLNRKECSYSVTLRRSPEGAVLCAALNIIEY